MRTIALLLMACTGVALAQGDTIYRCDDGKGGVLYTNSPCAKGRLVDIPESRFDPAARERLQRELAAFERRQATREAQAREREKEAALGRAALAAASPPDPPQAEYPYYYAYAPYYPYPPRVKQPIKPRPRQPQSSAYIRVR